MKHLNGKARVVAAHLLPVRQFVPKFNQSGFLYCGADSYAEHLEFPLISGLQHFPDDSKAALLAVHIEPRATTFIDWISCPKNPTIDSCTRATFQAFVWPSTFFETSY